MERWYQDRFPAFLLNIGGLMIGQQCENPDILSEGRELGLK